MSVKTSALILKKKNGCSVNDEENIAARRLPRDELITTMEQRVIRHSKRIWLRFSQVAQFSVARLTQIIPLNTPLKILFPCLISGR